MKPIKRKLPGLIPIGSKQGDDMNNFENSIQAAHDVQLAELTVLKEKQQDKKKSERGRKSNFCKFCDGKSSDLNGFSLIGNRLYFRRFRLVLADTNINFCPLCGKKLREQGVEI